jgi:hypothetical protein
MRKLSSDLFCTTFIAEYGGRRQSGTTHSAPNTGIWSVHKPCSCGLKLISQLFIFVLQLINPIHEGLEAVEEFLVFSEKTFKLFSINRNSIRPG